MLEDTITYFSLPGGKSFARRLASWALVLLFAGVAAENAGAQDPGYLLTDYLFDTLGIGVFNTDGSNVYNVFPNSAATAPGAGCALAAPYSRPLYPSAPRDGSLIAFLANGGTPELQQVFVMNGDGSDAQQVTFPIPGFVNSWAEVPVISPDGTKIAFVSHRTTTNQEYVLFTANVDGSGEPTQIAPSVSVSGIAWSPDSKQLAFVSSDCGFNWAVRVINADGTGERLLACKSPNGPAIDWAPDGTRIAYVQDYTFGPGIRQIRPDGTFLGDITPAQLGELNNARLGGFRYSPDSTRLAYANQTGCFVGVCTFRGISFINVDGTGRQDAINDQNPHGFWWQPGPAILPPTTLTLGPDPLVFGPGFRQQLSPVLKDSGGNILSRSAFGYCETAGNQYAIADDRGFVGRSTAPGPATTEMFVFNGGLTSNRITVRSEVMDPPISFYPATWDFGNQGVATTSATEFFTLQNTGSAMLNINAITLIGANAADYAFDPSSTCPLGGGGPLMPRDTCTVGVIFSPSDVGPRTAQINVDDDAPGSPQIIPLAGTGTMPAAAVRPRSALR